MLACIAGLADLAFAVLAAVTRDRFTNVVGAALLAVGAKLAAVTVVGNILALLFVGVALLADGTIAACRTVAWDRITAELE